MKMRTNAGGARGRRGKAWQPLQTPERENVDEKMRGGDGRMDGGENRRN
jgi:hypothetical protein